MRFRNPANGFIQEFPVPHLSYAVFGMGYLLHFGMWRHVMIMALTGGLAYFFYLFAIHEVVREHYLEKGWVELRNGEMMA